jgi:heat shock protein HtpX
MPLTFIDIERRKSWRIGVFFFLLILLYFVIALAIVVSFYQVLTFPNFSIPGVLYEVRSILIIFCLSLIVASLHFIFSTLTTGDYVTKNLGAVQPDPEDGIHKRLMNILHEIHVVTGNKKRIECFVIPSLSVNALSVVDLRGKALIAITEGLLSRLSRAQLEAVMAHEAYHILSGDCLESTVAASLFGMPSAGSFPGTGSTALMRALSV